MLKTQMKWFGVATLVGSSLFAGCMSERSTVNRVQPDYIDKNDTNHAYHNLILLCPKCHMGVHRTGVLPTVDEVRQAYWDGFEEEEADAGIQDVMRAEKLFAQGLTLKQVRDTMKLSGWQ